MNYALMLNPSIIRPLIFKWKLSWKTVWFLGLSLVISLIGFYIFQVSETTRISFTVTNYEKKAVELDREFKNLQINFSNVSSLSGLEGALVAKGYEKVGKISYIQMLEGAVVAK